MTLVFSSLLQMADNTGRRKENIVDLNKYLDKRIRVKFNGGRECGGTLKGTPAERSLVIITFAPSFRLRSIIELGA